MLELPTNVHHLIIKSSSFDTLAPCEHVLSLSNVTITVEDTETLTTCVRNTYTKI